MSSETTVRMNAAKGSYARPQLTAYGSVRNLTGGSQNNGFDGALGQTKN